jgi:hypothetical protein
MSLLGFAMITASKFAASAVRNAPIFPGFLELQQLESKDSLRVLNPIIALILFWLQPKYLQ